MRKSALVIAPGRGTYNKDELGYLYRHHSERTDLISRIDAFRQDQDQMTVSELDRRETFSIKEHTRGDNASPLIYACSYADFLSIDREKYEIVAITGNSMGWYIAMACAAALPEDHAIKLINTMGTLMQESLIGGQLVYPFVDEAWRPIEGRREAILEIMAQINQCRECELYISIEFGGMIVFGGNREALDRMQKSLEPQQGRFPLRLPNHAAFHTPLQKPISERACEIFAYDFFEKPDLPLIDGRGHIWGSHSTDIRALYDYTLRTQVCETYDFTKAVQVSMKEFAPDTIIVLGPGTTLGGAVAQSLIGIEWQGLSEKSAFILSQKGDHPTLFAMGMEEQRKEVV